jgi:hypothetical protein
MGKAALAEQLQKLSGKVALSQHLRYFKESEYPSKSTALLRAVISASTKLLQTISN